MQRVLLLLIAVPAFAAGAGARAAAPLYDPVVLNIGLACKWQQRCIAIQRGAMKRAMGYVRKEHPSSWRIHMCNRNASRGRYRVDWVGFNNCIRNVGLRPAPHAVARRRS